MNSLKSALALSAILWVSGCNTAEFCNAGFTAMTVQYTNEPAVDGCGWVLTVADTLYFRPEVLADEWKENGLEVWVDFTQGTDSFTCNRAPNVGPVITINEIVLRGE